ncbi:hypothetical protein BJ165DRAFT_1400360 [Panaeolus papilionaceus]|nr:hypothetical protein BJ165DRAFT_1400360 [Panaeolus papilionaceus]
MSDAASVLRVPQTPNNNNIMLKLCWALKKLYLCWHQEVMTGNCWPATRLSFGNERIDLWPTVTLLFFHGQNIRENRGQVWKTLNRGTVTQCWVLQLHLVLLLAVKHLGSGGLKSVTVRTILMCTSEILAISLSPTSHPAKRYRSAQKTINATTSPKAVSEVLNKI